MTKLTAEFIKANRVVFAPQTEAEAEAIQQWMFKHGIRWADGTTAVRYLESCIRDKMVVEQRTLYRSPDKSRPFIKGCLEDLVYDERAASHDHQEKEEPPVAPSSALVLTPQFLQTNHVFFRPESAAEAEYIQRRLFELGVVWHSGGTSIKEIGREGMNVDRGGKLFAGEDASKPYVLASAKNFPDFDAHDILPMREQIISLRNEIMTLNAKIDRLLEMRHPVVFLGKRDMRQDKGVAP